MRYTQKKLRSDARWYGLDVFTYSPGDGVTRYRFAVSNSGEGYFACYGIGDCFGIAEARIWLQGYGNGMVQTRKQRDASY